MTRLRSACVSTVVVSTKVLFVVSGSVVTTDLVVTVLVIVLPGGVFAFTRTTRVNVAVAPAASDDEAIASAAPVLPPTGGVLTPNPAGAVKETKVVFAGIWSCSDAFAELLGPLFVIVIV